MEIIVVNDGSTDDTEKVLRAQKGITVISYPTNKGKTFALSQGIAAASGDLIMLIDADLSGLTTANISSLILPVREGIADVSISLRRNSLWIYRLIGLDFVSGERVLPRALLFEAVETMQQLPRWGGEVFMNQHIVEQKMSIAVVRWQNVYNIRKFEKVGLPKGFAEEWKMIRDACEVLSVWGVVSQNLTLLRRKVPSKSFARSPSVVSVE